MNERKYLADNNAYGFIGAKRRASAFFKEHCRLTEDVLYEARFTTSPPAVASTTENVSPTVLEQLAVVMKTVAVGDTGLVDLYGNKGAADPVLVATAVVLQKIEETSLFPDSWVIVTRDKAVLAKAEEFGVTTATPEILAALIDTATP